MKDRLPLCHRVDFLEIDSEMEISVLTVSLGSVPGNNTTTCESWREAELGRGRSWVQQTPQVVLELSGPSELSQTGHKVRFYNPHPTFSLPLPLS